jgi:hypothetical protein
MTRSKHHIDSIVGDFAETRARFWWLPHAFLPCLARQGRILALLMSFLEHNHLTEVVTKGAEFPMLWRSMLEHAFVTLRAVQSEQMK